MLAMYDYPPKPERVRWWDDPEARSGVFWGCMVQYLIPLSAQ